VAAAVSNLPDRILSLLPQIGEDIAAKIHAEITDVMRSAKEIRLEDAIA
jgi:hypothetical protein